MSLLPVEMLRDEREWLGFRPVMTLPLTMIFCWRVITLHSCSIATCKSAIVANGEFKMIW